MIDLLKKGFYAVIGGAVLCGKEVKAIKASAIRRAADSEKEGREAVRKLTDSCRSKTGTALCTDEEVEKILRRLDVPLRKEFADLELRIRSLEDNEHPVSRG
jgi:hypothetical protein